MPRQLRWKAAEQPSQHNKSPSLLQSLHVSSCCVARCSLAWLSAYAHVLITVHVDPCPKAARSQESNSIGISKDCLPMKEGLCQKYCL